MFFVRPYLYEFLNQAIIDYEIVIYTAGTKTYADLILDTLDPNKEYFSSRLYRESTILYKNEVIKDLSIIKKDLSKVIFIDNLESNFRLQPDNGVHIKTWTNDIWDKQLLYLAKFIRNIANECVVDVRNKIKELKSKVILNYNPSNLNVVNSFNHNFFNNINVINQMQSNKEPDYEMACMYY